MLLALLQQLTTSFVLLSAPYHKGAILYIIWTHHFAPCAESESDFFFSFYCFALYWLAMPFNSFHLIQIIEMCSRSLSNAVTSLTVKTPGRCVSTSELFSGGTGQWGKRLHFGSSRGHSRSPGGKKKNAKKKRQNAAQHIEDQSSVHNETHTCGEWHV